mmetsp:Transcript_21021/g.48024  ORF Transcript_21021/g.48024 Transcript_21021/m.48024 type:complete len:324 (-) Transcript_21021:122-1093(-)
MGRLPHIRRKLPLHQWNCCLPPPMCLPHSSRSKLCLHGVDDGGEGIALERCAANQEAVDVWLLAELRTVFVIHGATVLDAHGVAHLLGDVVLEPLPEVGVNLFGLIRRGHLAGADGPDGLVGKDDLLPVRLGERRREGLHLLVQDVEGGACLARLQLLADAGEGAQAVFDGKLGLVSDRLARLAAILAALAVPQDNPLDAHVREHLARDLAGPGARVLVPEVLRGHRVVAAQLALHLREVDKWRRTDDLHVHLGVNLELAGIEFLNELAHALWGTVGLPVAADDELPRLKGRAAKALGGLASGAHKTGGRDAQGVPQPNGSES